MKRVLIACLLAVTCTAMAVQGHAMPREGSDEIEVSGSYFRPLGNGNGIVNADVQYGHYFDQALQLGLRQSFNYFQRGDADNSWVATTAPFINLHFPGVLDGVVPFIGGQIGMVWNDDDTAGIIGPEGGLKFYFNKDTYLVARYRYQWYWDSFDSDYEDAAAHVVNVGLGFSW